MNRHNCSVIIAATLALLVIAVSAAFSSLQLNLLSR